MSVCGRFLLNETCIFCYCSGWKPDQTDRYAQFARQASAVTKSSLYMEEAALVSRTPGKLPFMKCPTFIRCIVIRQSM